MAGLNDLLINSPVRIFSVWELLEPDPDWRVDWGPDVDTESSGFQPHRDLKGVRVIWEPENRIWILTGEREGGCCGGGGYEGKWPD